MPLNCTFRWSSFNITMTRSTSKWYWSVSNDEDNIVAQGDDSDAHHALAAALVAFDAAVKKDKEGL